MAGIGFGGGLGVAGSSFLEGYAGAQDMLARREDREYLKQQRARLADEQRRGDEERANLAGIQTTKDIEVDNPDYVEPVYKDDEGNDMPGVAAKPKTVTKTIERTPYEIAKDTASVYQKSGNLEKYTAAQERADKLAFQQSSRDAAQLIAESAGNGVSLMQMAEKAGKIFHDDPFGGGIKGITDNGDGSITVMQYNKHTGQEIPKTFTSKTQLSEALQAHYAPDTYAEIQKARIKAQENAMDPSKRYMRVGNSVYDTATQTFQSGPVPPGFVYDGEGADGQPRYVRGGTGGGSGAGAGSGSGKGKGAPADATSAALSHFDSVVQHSEDKLPIDQASQARDYVSRLATTNPSMPPAMVSRVAIAAAKDPNKLVPAINPDTGLIDTVFDDGQNGKITFNTGIGSAAKPGNIKPEQLTQMTATLLASKSPQEKAELVAAANDPKARGAIEDRMRKQAADVIAQRTQGLNEQQAAVVTQQINDALETKLGYLGNNLDMIAKYGEKPPVKKPEGGSKIAQPGGLPKFSGLSGKQLDAAVNADAQAQVDANRGRAQEVEKARKAAAADPELIKLEQERSALLRKGDAVGANSKIAEYNKLKSERYGL